MAPDLITILREQVASLQAEIKTLTETLTQVRGERNWLESHQFRERP